MNKIIRCKTKAKNVGMDLSSKLEVRWTRERLEQERESVEIGSNTLQSHTKVDGECRNCTRTGMDSNDGVPDERIRGRMGKIENWMGGGYQLTACSHGSPLFFFLLLSREI